MEQLMVHRQGVAGTLESSDIQIMINKNMDNGIEIELSSSVEKQYGQQIRKVITETLMNLGMENVKLKAQDQGALDCTIKARTIAAAYRAANKVSSIDWEGIEEWNV